MVHVQHFDNVTESQGTRLPRDVLYAERQCRGRLLVDTAGNQVRWISPTHQTYQPVTIIIQLKLFQFVLRCEYNDMGFFSF